MPRNAVSQLMLALALNEREAALCDEADMALGDSQVCHFHRETTLEQGDCPMCELDFMSAQLDERYVAKSPAKKWWQSPVADSPRPLPESAAFTRARAGYRSEWG